MKSDAKKTWEAAVRAYDRVAAAYERAAQKKTNAYRALESAWITYRRIIGQPVEPNPGPYDVTK